LDFGTLIHYEAAPRNFVEHFSGQSRAALLLPDQHVVSAYCYLSISNNVFVGVREMVELVKETFYIKSHLENDVDFNNFARETQNNGNA
jgi:hypothetical protein